MLRRVAFLLILLLISGSALLAARHYGIQLPWDIAAVDPEPASKDREQPPSAAPETTPETKAETTVDETTAALGGTADEPPAPGSGNVSIDISRISPGGVSVIAGRAEPDSYVTVLENGKPAGTAKADSFGEWSLSTEYRFASADPKLSYEVSRTPPPAPEPPKQEVAAASKPPAAEPAPPSAASVAGEVMRKFENLVEEAREEAKKSEAEKEAAKPAESPAAETAKPAAEAREDVAGAPEIVPEAPADKTDETTTADTGAGSQEEAAPAAEPAPRAEANVALAPTAPQESKPETTVIPVPIMFVYNEATLTGDGERAAALLLEYLKLKKLDAVELTGHADERGSDAYNFDLSRERLETVARILKDGGYTGELKLTPKGKSEPYMGVDRSAYRGEALYQLDRRVELRLGR